MYRFSIPKFTIKNLRIRKIRQSFPMYLITPISLTVVNCGDMAKKNDEIYVNMFCKTVTILDVYNKIKKIFRRN